MELNPSELMIIVKINFYEDFNVDFAITFSILY